MSPFRADLLEGRVALVTGGGTGIGRGIAGALAAHGARTVILSRSGEHLTPAAEAISAASGRACLPLVADVRRPEQVEAAVGLAVGRMGRLDILVNGAAGNFLCAAADLTPNGFGTVLDIDAKGTWNVTRAVYHAWMRQNGGQVLNLSATLHYGGTPRQLHVAAAKAAVDALTRSLAVEWGPQGIRVNAIAPGPIADTEGARRLFPDEAADRLRGVIPSRRLGTIEDVVNLTLFVLSDAGVNLNGAILVTDGGLCLTGSFGLGFEVAGSP
jgi:peroxisomal 2,4-dienoyl-CoA reductase